ncbi:MAG: sigma-70 family RNA polymerase sigma factor [bacterium]|nr:sigma-70 family RNA polymerase sigma factor [bacterium]
MSKKELLRPTRSATNEPSNKSDGGGFEDDSAVSSIKPSAFVEVITHTWKEVTPQQAVNIYNTCAPMLSLNSPLGRDGEPEELIDSIPQATNHSPEEIAEQTELTEKLAAGCRKLPSPLLEVIKLRFVLGLSLEDAGKVLGCSRTTVLKHEREALSALRGMPEIEGLTEFLSSVV